MHFNQAYITYIYAYLLTYYTVYISSLTSHWMKVCVGLCLSKSATETQKTSDISQTHALYNTEG